MFPEALPISSASPDFSNFSPRSSSKALGVCLFPALLALPPVVTPLREISGMAGLCWEQQGDRQTSHQPSNMTTPHTGATPWSLHSPPATAQGVLLSPRSPRMACPGICSSLRASQQGLGTPSWTLGAFPDPLPPRVQRFSHCSRQRWHH